MQPSPHENDPLSWRREKHLALCTIFDFVPDNNGDVYLSRYAVQRNTNVLAVLEREKFVDMIAT